MKRILLIVTLVLALCAAGVSCGLTTWNELGFYGLLLTFFVLLVKGLAEGARADTARKATDG